MSQAYDDVEPDAPRLLIEARKTIEEYEQLFAQQHKRTAQADKLWQEATGRHQVMPDLGVLMDWLLDDKARLEFAMEHLAIIEPPSIDKMMRGGTVRIYDSRPAIDEAMRKAQSALDSKPHASTEQ